MLPVAWISAALAMLAPHVHDARADRIATAVAITAGDDVDLAAALVVTAEGESSFRRDVETCEVRGLGGRGLFGTGPGWGPESRRCGGLAGQARIAARALATDLDPEAMFARFIAAPGMGPEVRRRSGLFLVTRERIAIGACL